MLEHLQRRSRAPVRDPACVCARLLGTRDAAPRGNQPLIVAQLVDKCRVSRATEDSFVCSQPLKLESVQEH